MFETLVVKMMLKYLTWCCSPHLLLQTTIGQSNLAFKGARLEAVDPILNNKPELLVVIQL